MIDGVSEALAAKNVQALEELRASLSQLKSV